MPTGEHLKGKPAQNRFAGLRQSADGVLVRRCSRCQAEKPRTRDHWSPDKRTADGMMTGWCRKCITTWAKSRNTEVRMQALLAYSQQSPRCACCSEDRFEFLALDHIDGGGNAHRLETTGSKKGGTGFFSWLMKNNYPPGFQVLCHNCNQAKASYGRCPHEGEHRSRALCREDS